MGFLDDVQSSLNRSMAATGRATTTMRLKNQMNEVLKRRQGLAAQLGASLYEATRGDATLRAGREALYDGIAACDEERAQYQAQIDQLEAERAAAAASSQFYVCPFCQSQVTASDLFCSGCGRSMADIQAELAARQQAAFAAQQQAYAAPGAYPGAYPGQPVAQSQPGIQPQPGVQAQVAGQPQMGMQPQPGGQAQPGVQPQAGSGQPVAQPSAAAPAGSTCPQCGAPIGAGDVFCMSCGYRLNGSAAGA